MVAVKVNTPVNVEIDKMTWTIYSKDETTFVLTDTNGNTILDYEGYVPHCLIPGSHGDYATLEIDINTGQILNWKKPDAHALADFIETHRN